MSIETIVIGLFTFLSAFFFILLLTLIYGIYFHEVTLFCLTVVFERIKKNGNVPVQPARKQCGKIFVVWTINVLQSGSGKHEAW